MPTEVSGALELRKALKKIEPVLAKEAEKEIRGLLRVVAVKARGFVPSESPLSGWANAVGVWESRAFNTRDIKAGIGYSTAPSKPNKRGFRSIATVFNKSAAGSIYETAGRKSGADGQPWVGPKGGGRDVSRSNNPQAGAIFIGSMGPLYGKDKQRGRLIFKAWEQDQGKATLAVAKAIDKAVNTFNAVGGAGNQASYVAVA